MPAETVVALRDVTLAYEGASDPSFMHESVHFPLGFTGVVGANGAGKSTRLRLVSSALTPRAGNVELADTALYCDQRSGAPPANLTAFLTDREGAAASLRARLSIDEDFQTRCPTLSHGERKRAQIACALWREPQLLALDEPTNHVDATCDLLLAALARYRGMGLVVSHDRELLDTSGW